MNFEPSIVEINYDRQVREGDQGGVSNIGSNSWVMISGICSLVLVRGDLVRDHLGDTICTSDTVQKQWSHLVFKYLIGENGFNSIPLS